MYLSNNKYKIMKKIVIVLFLFIGIATFAQSVTGSPSGYTVIDENVELIIDVTGATDNDGNSIEGKDLYIWTWSSAGDGKTNGGWTSIKDAAKLEKLSDTQYRLKFPITDGADTYKTIAELYGAEAAPGSIKSIGFLLRDQAPTFQTGDSSIPFSPFKFDVAEVRTFPSQATTKDVVTFRFNKEFQTLSNIALTGAQNISVHIEPSSDASLAIDQETIFDGRYFQSSIIPASVFETLFTAGTLNEVKFYFFDTDNPNIKSTESSLQLKEAGN